MTKKIERFLAEQRPATPCLVMDLDVVADNFRRLRTAVPRAGIYYAVKANPAPEILNLLAKMGSSFDTASVNEIDMALATGVTADRISYGNTIKKKTDIAAAHERGVGLFAFDSSAELAKISEAAPGSRVFCRILTSGASADWPLSRKFGCDVADGQAAPDRGGHARRGAARRVVPCRLAAARPGAVGRGRGPGGLAVPRVRGGRRDPVDAQYRRRLPDALPAHHSRHGGLWRGDRRLAAQAFRQPDPRHHCRARPPDGGQRRRHPDRGRADLAASPRTTRSVGSISTSASSAAWPRPWTKPSSIRSLSSRKGAPGPGGAGRPDLQLGRHHVREADYRLPDDLEIGDKLEIRAAGAYTTTYASVAFNGFEPLKTYCV